MKDKYIYFQTARDVVRTECELNCGDVEIIGCDDAKFGIERTRHTLLKISESDGAVKIKQIGKPLFHRAAIKIYVPAYCVPDITLKAKQGKIKISDGIFGDLRIKYNDAEISLAHASFVNTDICCNDVAFWCSDISVKSSFDCTADNGEGLMENSYCSNLDIRFKSGGIGITELKCPDSFLSVERGSLNVIMKGSSDDFTLNLVSKHGTCNRESVYGGSQAFKAYTEYGNIVVDFTEHKEDTFNGNDYVAEDPRVARGA